MDIRLEIVGERVVCKQGGRETLSAHLSDFLEAVLHRADAMLLPDAIPEGVRFIRRRGEVVVLVLEEQAQVRTVRWLADDSPAPLGRGARYRTARLAFPFVILILAFREGGLTGYQQCFYRASPLRSLQDPLYFPNLYNVASAYRQACWLCLTGLKDNLTGLLWEEKLRAVRKHFWGAAFNASSEIHEGMSYWRAMRGVDPRVASLDAWEAATKQDPFFPLTVLWRPAGKTVGQVLIEMLNAIAPHRPPSSAAELGALLPLCPRCPTDGKTGARASTS
jgi:hypothetical protein